MSDIYNFTEFHGLHFLHHCKFIMYRSIAIAHFYIVGNNFFKEPQARRLCWTASQVIMWNATCCCNNSGLGGRNSFVFTKLICPLSVFYGIIHTNSHGFKSLLITSKPILYEFCFPITSNYGIVIFDVNEVVGIDLVVPKLDLTRKDLEAMVMSKLNFCFYSLYFWV